MNGESNLKKLLKNINPALSGDRYVFLTSKTAPALTDINKSKMIFREKEGTTLIIKETEAKKSDKHFNCVWALITLSVHSDLQAIGFLAAITRKMAEAKISVNAVSAYYHDHLFVPWEKRHEAVRILKDFYL